MQDLGLSTLVCVVILERVRPVSNAGIICSEFKLFLILLWTPGSLVMAEAAAGRSSDLSDPKEILGIKEPGWQVIILLWKSQC